MRVTSVGKRIDPTTGYEIDHVNLEDTWVLSNHNLRKEFDDDIQDALLSAGVMGSDLHV